MPQSTQQTHTKLKASGSYTDQELLTLLQQQNRGAFTAIYTKYWAVLASFATRLLEDEEEAIDVVQDVFTKIWNNRNELVITSSLKSYLYVSVRNRIISKKRHQKYQDNYADSLIPIYQTGEFVTDEQVRLRELVRQIEKEVAKLPDRMREVFELSRFEGLNYQQISEELGIANDTVKKQIHKALKVLKTKIHSLLFSLL